ncbi:hypothetical protein Phum_PHUM196240 [Pediculus humanus corporis]|uniref:Uncharacterized protein n=1 Tax=Pediculus humanus subsp. corporis TaxID=121224 RepID=E0VH02_PEDHC|nr:uncharacterized protein Phum_PHUM196240 [Pediculus humanus corporis]EEB12658.1 hypothetical protein Phum_PHUM196240 [Pediculus humanus corporis]
MVNGILKMSFCLILAFCLLTSAFGRPQELQENERKDLKRQLSEGEDLKTDNSYGLGYGLGYGYGYGGYPYGYYGLYGLEKIIPKVNFFFFFIKSYGKYWKHFIL